MEEKKQRDWQICKIIYKQSQCDTEMCCCMSKWADVPEVALISVAKSDEPFSAWILCNTWGWAVSGKEIKHRVIDFKRRPLCRNHHQSVTNNLRARGKHTDLV